MTLALKKYFTFLASIVPQFTAGNCSSSPGVALEALDALLLNQRKAFGFKPSNFTGVLKKTV